MVSKESIAYGTGALVTAVALFYSGYWVANRNKEVTIDNKD